MGVVTAAIVALTLAVSSAGLAQGATDAPLGTDEPLGTPSPFCGVLTADEASTALGVTLTVGSSSDYDCSYDSDPSTSDVNLNVRREDGPFSGDYPKSLYPDGTDLQIAGHVAYYAAGSTILYVDEGSNNQLFVLELAGAAPDSIDIQAALTSLARKALPRLASIPVPVEPSPQPEPSFFGDAELAALIPTEIAGSPVDISTNSGADFVAQTDPTDPSSQDMLQQITDLLTAQGKTIDDLSTAYATFATDVSYGEITAVRIKGADIATLTNDLLPLLLGYVDPQQTPTTIAGKAVMILTDGPLVTASPDPSADPYATGADTVYIYPKGDVLWFVSATEPTPTEIFQKLP